MSGTTGSVQVIALNPGLDETDRDAWHALLHEAARLATAADAGLQVATLGQDDAPRALACPATWWQFRHDAPRDDADSIVQLGCAMLEHEGLRSAQPTLVLLPAGPDAETLAARLAARCGGVTQGRCETIALDADGVHATRASHGGRLRLALQSRARLCFATWRPAASNDAEPSGAKHAPTLRRIHLDTSLPPAPRRTILPAADAQPPLAGARIVVSGGRGMQGGNAEENGFALLARIAQSLGAALGGSLPAVDAGWLPVARQIGQSGKFVAPRIYLAVGISGTLQHLAGVSRGSRIVAINSDADAPIFDFAEVGVVADWRELLPRLHERLAARE